MSERLEFDHEAILELQEMRERLGVLLVRRSSSRSRLFDAVDARHELLQVSLHGFDSRLAAECDGVETMSAERSLGKNRKAYIPLPLEPEFVDPPALLLPRAMALTVCESDSTLRERASIASTILA